MAHQKQGNGRWQKGLQDRCEIVEDERGRACETPLRGLGNGPAPATLIVGKGLDRVVGQGVEKGRGGVAVVGEAMDVDNDCTRGCRGGLKIPAAKVFFQESQITMSFVCFREGGDGTEKEGFYLPSFGIELHAIRKGMPPFFGSTIHTHLTS